MPLDHARQQFVDDRVDVERAHLGSDARELDAKGLGRGISEPGMAHAAAAQDTDDDAAQAMFGRAEPWSASLDTPHFHH